MKIHEYREQFAKELEVILELGTLDTRRFETFFCSSQ
jgi:hypothetical protein